MSKKYAIRLGVNGMHLFDRQSGINILCDEINVAPSLWSRAPRQISMAVTNVCDLQCHFCYAPKSKVSLDPAIIFKWLVELDRNGCLGIGFGGGEPMLYSALPRICAFATQNTHLAVTMTTHGHRITQTLAKELQGNVNYIRVSVDSVGPYYETVRGRTIDELRAKLELIRTVARFGINCVVNSTNISELDAVAEFAAREGASELLLLPQQQTHRVQAAADSTVCELKSWIASYNGPIPLSISASASACLPVLAEDPAAQALSTYAHIDAGGLLKRSSYDGFGIPIGKRPIVEALDMLAQINR